MARVAINTGSTANDGTGDTLRAAGGIINSNFSDIYNYFGDGTNLNFSSGNFEVTAVGINTLSSVGIGTTNPRFDLEVGAVGASGTSLWVNGNARVTGILTVGTASIVLDGDSNTISVGSGVTINGDTGIIDATSIVVGGTTLTGAAVTRIEAGSGISVDQNTGQVTISATGGGGGTGYWEQNSTGINTTSNVGIGTTTASSALTVSGDVSVSGVSTFGTGDRKVKIQNDAITFSSSDNSAQIYGTGYGGLTINTGDVSDLLTLNNYSVFYKNGNVSLNNGQQGNTNVGSGITFYSATGGIHASSLVVSDVSTLSSDVSIGGTVSVDGSIKLTGINTSLVGTSGTSGDIKTIGGYPFYHDGTAWREFVLSSGTPVSVPVDTEWNNVVFRATFDNDFTDAKFEATPVYVGTGATIVGAAVTIGTGAYANIGGYSVGVGVSYPYRSEYDFTGSWTIEFWAYHDDTPGGNEYHSLISQHSETDQSGSWSFGIFNNAGSNMFYYWSNENSSTNKETLNIVSVAAWQSIYLNKWNHYALVREGDNGSLHFYINGVETSYTINDTIIDNDIIHINGAGLGFGAAFGNGRPFINGIAWNSGLSIDAIFDDVRISAGVGTAGQRYTSIGISTYATFTPPTTALPTTGTLPSIVNPSISAGPVSASSLNVTGISTLGTVQVSSGIVTATSGIVTYYGDTSNTAVGRWTLGASGVDHYTFTGIGITADTTNDPTIFLQRGKRYEFVNNMGAHPFRIQNEYQNTSGQLYEEGVTNNGVTNGTLSFEVPMNAPNKLYYQCGAHVGMSGTIFITPEKDIPVGQRTIVSASTGSIGAGTSTTVDINGFKSYGLLKVTVDHPSWVTLYVDSDSRTSDSGRSYLVDPDPGSGVIAEVRSTTAGISTFLMSPGVIGWNNDTTTSETIYARVTNNDSVSRDITVDLSVVKLEG